jgi:adenine-specific DNA-methyltransferase
MQRDTQASQNIVMLGDCVTVMEQFEAESIDFILTDPPYLTRYRSRDGRTLRNDDNDRWLVPAYAEMFRVLKDRSFCVSFYGWGKADRFIAAWRAAGFQHVGHIVFTKPYASAIRFMRAEHEQAYLLAKGKVAYPFSRISDVIPFAYTGNFLHPTQKPIRALTPLIRALCPPDGVVLDPFCGSGSTLVAARNTGRRFIGIELDRRYWQTASERLRWPPFGKEAA